MQVLRPLYGFGSTRPGGDGGGGGTGVSLVLSKLYNPAIVPGNYGTRVYNPEATGFRYTRLSTNFIEEPELKGLRTFDAWISARFDTSNVARASIRTRVSGDVGDESYSRSFVNYPAGSHYWEVAQPDSDDYFGIGPLNGGATWRVDLVFHPETGRIYWLFSAATTTDDSRYRANLIARGGFDFRSLHIMRQGFIMPKWGSGLSLDRPETDLTSDVATPRDLPGDVTEEEAMEIQEEYDRREAAKTKK